MLPPETAETDLQEPAVPPGSGENLRIAPAPPIAPPGLAPDQLAQLLDDWAGTIPVDDCALINGRLQRMTLGQLDRMDRVRGAYWRGVFMERYRLGGALPLRLPESDLSASGAGPLPSDPPGDKAEQAAADQGDESAEGR